MQNFDLTTQSFRITSGVFTKRPRARVEEFAFLGEYYW